ncbi:cytochrome P450 [Mycena capillaripes]|nr:cytochrome P450 [Mycena capillaripes]
MACFSGAFPAGTCAHVSPQTGNLLQLQLAENYGDHEFQWLKQYGPLYKIKGCFGEDRLVISDPLALRHILNNPSFTRPSSVSKATSLVFGEETLSKFLGDDHRRLRAAMGPVFSGNGVRTFLPVYLEVAKTIVREWESICAPGSLTRLDVAEFMDHATLDVICNGAKHDSFLCLSLMAMAKSKRHWGFPSIPTTALARSKAGVIGEFITKYTPASFLRVALRLPVDPMRAIFNFQTVTKKIMEEKFQDLKTAENERRDLLSIILAGSSVSKKTRMTPIELVQQIPTFLLAGQETTATTLCWCLYQLAQNPEFQQKLRKEILFNVSQSDGCGLEYDSMPMLNALLKIYPRLCPAAPLAERYASEDSVLPLSSEIITSTGKHLSELPIKKGQFIHLAVGAYQRMEALWGTDAHEFKPSRWLEGDPCAGQALGPYAHLLAFHGGPRFCLGWRFAILEMQVILTELLAKFAFSLPKDSVVRAYLAGTQLPADSAGMKCLWLSVERVNDATQYFCTRIL